MFGKFKYKRRRKALELLGKAKCSDEKLQPHRTEKHPLLVLLALVLPELRIIVLPMIQCIPILRTAKVLNFTKPTSPPSGATVTSLNGYGLGCEQNQYPSPNPPTRSPAKTSYFPNAENSIFHGRSQFQIVQGHLFVQNSVQYSEPDGMYVLND